MNSMMNISGRMRMGASLLLGCVVCGALGCGGGKEPEVMAVEEVPAAVENAFKDASDEVKQSVEEVVSAVKGKDESKALLDLQEVFARPDLSPAQREAANQSMISLNQKLRAAAEQGDQRAAQALEVYRARK